MRETGLYAARPAAIDGHIYPYGSSVAGSDDANWYFAEFEWPAAMAGTYVMRVTSFEGVNTRVLEVDRDGAPR